MGYADITAGMNAGDNRERDEEEVPQESVKQNRRAVDRMLFEIQRLKVLLAINDSEGKRPEGSS